MGLGKFNDIPDGESGRFVLLVHRDDLQLVVRDGALAFDAPEGARLAGQPVPCGEWLTVVVEGRPVHTLAGCPFGDIPDAPQRHLFRHAYLCEWQYDAGESFLSTSEPCHTDLFLPSGRPLDITDFLLFRPLCATESVEGLGREVVATEMITITRMLLRGANLHVESSCRYGDDLPIAAMEAVDEEYRRDPEGFWRVYFGEEDFWLCVRAEADSRKFL